MENQDHKVTTPSGHENHTPHLCHKCDWPFPNPHPSARHRRAHKKVCGKIEGYKLSESEADNSIHSAVSDDDELSPSPKEMKSVKEIGTITDKSYRSEDETFSDAVAEFSDSGISPGMEDRLEGVEILSTGVNRFDDKLLKADTTGGSLTDVAEVNDPESLESATHQSEAAKSLDTGLDRPISLQLDADPIESEIPVDAPLPEITATATIEDKQVQQMSSGQPNDLKESVDINSDEGLVDVVEVSQSVVSGTDMRTSNNGSYESKPQEAEGKISDPLSLPSDLHGADSKISNPSPVESSKLLEADNQAIDSVPTEAKIEHEESINSVPLDSKLNSSVVDVKALDVLNVGLEQEQVDKTLNAPILELEADSSNEIDGVSQISKTDEEREEDVHVVSLGKDLPALDNPKLMLKDFKDYSKFKSSLPLDLGSAKDDFLAASEASQPSVALDVSGDQVSEENIVVSTEVKMDSTANNLSEPGPLSTDHSDADTFLSSVKEEGKQATEVDDDPVIEVTETSLSIAEESQEMAPGGSDHDEHENARTEQPMVSATESEKERTEEKPAGVSESEKTVVTATTLLESKDGNLHDASKDSMVGNEVSLGGSDHGEHEKARTEQPIVSVSETEKERTEEKPAGVSESEKTIVTATTVLESKDGNLHEVSKDSTISNDAKVLESTGACDVKEPAGLLVDTDSKGPDVVDNSHAGDGLQSATDVISSPSRNEGSDKLTKQNDTVSPVDMSVTSSSNSLDANWGSVSVLSTQSESTTAVPEKSDRDLQKQTSGAGSDTFEPPSFMTLVESGESTDKKTTDASEIETQQQPKTEAALKAGWFPSITNVVNESQGRKKNEEIIAKVTNWSSTTGGGGKQQHQHTPLKNLLGEAAAAKSPNAKQVPSTSAIKKDETAAAKTTVNSILSSEAAAPTSKEAAKEWNSPARYPVDIKKEKKKTKPYWVPFVCCSSVHQDA